MKDYLIAFNALLIYPINKPESSPKLLKAKKYKFCRYYYLSEKAVKLTNSVNKSANFTEVFKKPNAIILGT